MPPSKRRESKSTKNKEPVNDESWQSEIEKLSLNDDRWRCVIAMIVETNVEHVKYTELFNEAAEEETRDSIFALSYNKLIRDTKLIAKSYLNQSSLGQGVCRFASQQIAEVGEAAMSPWLLSKLIKFFVYRAKMKNLEILESRIRTETEIAKGMEALQTVVNTEKFKVGSGDAKSFDKANSRLRKRGEEWKDKVRIDDAPLGGPNLYVVLSGFRDPRLPSELLNNGLPLTAIFKIVRPDENLDVFHRKFDETQKRIMTTNVARNLETKMQLHTFWSTFEAALKDPKTAAKNCQIICQTFCPPELPELVSEAEVEPWKSDAYRRISFLMYDLYDIKRQHTNYIRNMKLQPNLKEPRPSVQIRDIYDAIMSLVPEECATVPIVLDALLNQVAGIPLINEDNNGLKVEEVILDKATDHCQSKIDYLNHEFDVIRKVTKTAENFHPRLILHGDILRLKTHHCLANGVDLGIRVLKQSQIISLWRDVPALTNDQVNMYAYHIKQISDCFDVETDTTTIHHYLHLLLFEEMINSDKPRSNLREGELYSKYNDAHTASETVASLQPAPANFPYSFWSDSKIEYRKSIVETFECPELISLVDTREILSPDGLFSREMYPNQNKETVDIEKFDSVQILSADVFSQLFFECSQKYNVVKTRYFAPTDSILIFFDYRATRDRITKSQYTANIRTPVCLRDFSMFIVEEEKEWLAKEDEIHARQLTEEATLLKTQTTSETDELSMICRYTDEDFVLANSIKGAQLKKQKSRQTLIDVTESDELPAENKKKTGARKEIKKPVADRNKKVKTNGGVINSQIKRDESVGTNVSFLPLKKTISLRCAQDDEPFNFVGYDIGNYRVQVSDTTSELLSEDGTAIRVRLEEWSYAEPTLQVTVGLLGNSLVLHSFPGNRQMPPILHFTTVNGIIMGFTSREEPRVDLEAQSFPFFRASWPSGLVVETLSGDDPSNLFHVKQFYLSKGPECSKISNETHRVFLRNGTVIVFFNDDSVRLLHSNGRIITCNGFAKPESQDDKSEQEIKKRNNSSSDVAFLQQDIRSIVLDPDGRTYEIFNGEINRELEQELVRTASDYEVDEKFTRRSDGTNTLINSDGFLAVSFPDGSRITTGYVVEEDLVFCDWTDEEFESFASVSDEDLSSESKTEEENFQWQNSPSMDGFVSIFLTTCMEHRNYSTVTYDQSKTDCIISMPGNVAAHISSEAVISVTVDTFVSLKVERREIIFTGVMDTLFSKSSSSVYNLEHFSSSFIPTIPLLLTRDSFGNVLKVDFEGNTSYEKFERTFEQVYNDSGDGEENLTENHSSSSSVSIPLANLSQQNSTDCRLFVVKRDLTAYEYLCRSDSQAQEDEAKRDETTSIFYHQVPQQPSQILCTTFSALNPITTSQAWLQPYRVPSIRPTNADRRDLLRSTYSLPWDYLIPYGKNGRGIQDHTWDLPLRSNEDSSVPETLLVRTIQTIKNCNEKMFEKLQIALGLYWKKALNQFHEYRSFVSRRSASPEELEMENWLSDYALGRRKTFDRALYCSGLVKNWSDVEVESRPLARNRSQNEITPEEIEWYKNCLRDHIVPPYFLNVPGACFLWVLQRVNKIDAPLDEVEKGEEAEENRKEEEEEEEEEK